MFCPRIRHFVRLNANGTIGKCGHMTGGKGFDSMEEMEQSDWLDRIETQMSQEKWPDECVRCQRSEEAGQKSMRLNSIDRHRLLEPFRKDYLIVGGVLDNVCNSACQSCNAGLSTKIGSLESKDYPRVDNYVRFWEIPQDRIVEVDVSGGEPTASRNYKKVLDKLPPNTKIVRMNTNGSRTIPELEKVLQRGIKVIVTMSLDGIGQVHDYVRWPITWNKFEETLKHYLHLRDKYKLLEIDFWTTVSCLNINQLEHIVEYAKKVKIQHHWAFLQNPDVLNVRHSNTFTDGAKHLYPEQVAIDEDNNEDLLQFMARQDKLRGIDHKDYFNLF